jgi:hypothetical protein
LLILFRQGKGVIAERCVNFVLAMDNETFDLKILDLHWIKDEDDPNDLAPTDIFILRLEKK